MNINELYIYAKKQNIDVDYFPMKEITSFSMPGCIAIDVDKIENTADEAVHLAHELGHCVKGAFYNTYSGIDIKSRHEYKADKWAVQKLIPFDELMSAVDKGITTTWELAEHFNVTEKFIQRAIYIYQRIEKIKLI